MGMQWRTIELQNGNGMQATGNGYSLSATPGNGGGLNLSFTAGGSQIETPALMPSRDADKLLFGILPGDRVLVKWDFNVIRPAPSGSEQRCHLDGAIFAELHDLERFMDNINNGQVGRERARDREAAVEVDMVKLLCGFLPLEESWLARVRFAGWHGQGSASLLHSWESRVVFFLELNEAVKSPDLSKVRRENDSSPVLPQLQRRLSLLKYQHRQDFYGTEESTIGGNIDHLEALPYLFLDDCRDAYNHCTEALKEFGWDKPVATGSRTLKVTKCTQLATAHTFPNGHASRL